jgi:hypothetical protein
MVRAMVMAALLLGGCKGDEGKQERLAPTPPPEPAADAAVAPAGPDVSALIDRSLRRRDDGVYQVDRALLEAIVADPDRFTGGARLERHPEGLLLKGVWPRSLYARVGLANGDLLVAIGRTELTDPAADAAFYRALIDQRGMSVHFRRGGQLETLGFEFVHPPPPPPPPQPRPGADAVREYDRGDYDGAIAAALVELQQKPGDVRLLRILVSSYCITGDAPHARLFYRKLPPRDQEHMRRRCDKFGVTF